MHAKEEIKAKLLDYVEAITPKSKNGLYVCPLCASGTGKKGTGAFSVKDSHWKCFSCGEAGDIFSLFGKIEGIESFAEQAKGCAAFFGLPVTEAYMGEKRTEKGSNCKKANKAHCAMYFRGKALKDTVACEKTAYSPKETEGESPSMSPAMLETLHHTTASTVDYSIFFLQAHENIEESDYPAQRGLSQAVIQRFQLGYIQNWKHPKAGPKVPTSPRLIIPTSSHSYLARDVRKNIPEREKAYSKSQVGSIEIFNKTALFEASEKPLFVLEGALDALSVMEVGGEAIALGTTAKTKAFLELVAHKKPLRPLILALDNDEAGRKASRCLEDGLALHEIPFSVANIAGEHKDANEALQCGKSLFAEAILLAEQESQEHELAEAKLYKQRSALYDLPNFVHRIESVDTPFVPTRFLGLDRVLDGGLYEGLYIVGAISSLGKTTLIGQIADQIAEIGTDVLIFSLEMAKNEIIAKSLSRHTLQFVLEYGGDTRNAKTARGISTGSRYSGYSETEKNLIEEAIAFYGRYAEHIYISEGIGDIGVHEIRNAVKKHIKYTGKSPVIIVDYIQILAPCNERGTDKQNTDKAVMELKRISRDYKTPVIGISSFNRANYKEAVTMEAFKESGAIEYSSDVLLGLQLKGAGKKDFDVNEAKKKSPREIELVILKNRNGSVGHRLDFLYYPLFNYFKEL